MPNPGSGLVRNGKVGSNIAYVADWSTELPFVDVVKSGRPWTSSRDGAPWGQGGPLDLDSDGWIRSLGAGQYADLVLLNTGGHHPGGRYTLFWEGEGALVFWSAGVTMTNATVGRADVDIPGTVPDVFLRETTTNPANPIRNIRLIMPGHEGDYVTRPWNPAFLDTMRPFNSIRYLWWMRTSSGTAPGAMAEWSSRTTTRYAFQSDRGVALEYMIDLANTLYADPWFTLPHDATDDYVRRFAATVRDRLHPNLRTYVEYSNETWNSVYPQSDYVIANGRALGMSTNAFQAGLFFYARRAVQMFSIWENEFGGRSRLLRVLAAQSGNPWTGRQILDQATIEGNGNVGNVADVIAIAPYFQCVGPLLGTQDGANQIVAMTEDQVIDACFNEIRTDTRQTVSEYNDIARAAGLRLMAYESGQHMVGVESQQDNPSLAAKLNQVNRNQRMEGVYREYVALWKRLGGDEFEAFTSVGLYSQYGSFGFKEWQNQDSTQAPKYRALVERRVDQKARRRTGTAKIRDWRSVLITTSHKPVNLPAGCPSLGEPTHPGSSQRAARERPTSTLKVDLDDATSASLFDYVAPPPLEVAFETVFAKETARLFHLAWSVLRDRAEAEDAVQETMWKAWKAWPSVRDESKRSAWLTKICLHDCLRRKQRLDRTVAWDTNDPATADAGRAPGPLVGAAASSGRPVKDLDLDRAYKKLPQKQRAAIVLHYHHGYSIQQTAEAMGCRSGTVRTHVQRALATLRKELTDA